MVDSVKLRKGSLFSPFESNDIQKSLDAFLEKKTIIEEYFEERASKGPSFSRLPDNCKWCTKFQKCGLTICLNCGTNLKVI